MDVGDLKTELTKLNANMDLVSICNGDAESRLCLVREGEQWKVFFVERGARGWTDTFQSEHEACVGFLKAAMRDSAIVGAGLNKVQFTPKA